MRPYLTDEPDLENVRHLDMGAMPMILGMQRTGLLLDMGRLATLKLTLMAEQERLKEKVYQVTGHSINLSSADQVADLLFTQMGLKLGGRVKMTASRKRPTVDHDTLESMEHLHEVVGLILEHREVDKLIGTYVEPMPLLVKEDGRIHPKFGITPYDDREGGGMGLTATGRLTCRDPNLLAMPTRTAMGKEVRKCFIPSKGKVMGTIDLSQIELRVGAHRANCLNMIDAFSRDLDIHTFTASQMYNKSLDLVTKDERQEAKTGNFAIFFEISPLGLLNKMPRDRGWTERRCATFIDDWFSPYPEILTMRQMDHGRVRKHGMVWDFWGRTRQVPEVYSVHDRIKKAGLRQAANMPIQAGAQGIIKLAMADIEELIRSNQAEEEVSPLLQIHDEILFELREPTAEEFLEECGALIESSLPGFKVPMKWSKAIGESWGDLEK